jgi:hypothetical protein
MPSPNRNPRSSGLIRIFSLGRKVPLKYAISIIVGILFTVVDALHATHLPFLVVVSFYGTHL